MTCKTERYSGAARLDDYLESVRFEPFSWGTHDCLYFPLRAAETQTGVWHPPPAYTTLRGALHRAKTLDIVAEFDKRFERCAHVPSKGSIVLTPEDSPFRWRGGVVVSHRAAYVSPQGLIFATLQPKIELYWKVT